jgi:hypothetical protein
MVTLSLKIIFGVIINKVHNILWYEILSFWFAVLSAYSQQDAQQHHWATGDRSNTVFKAQSPLNNSSIDGFSTCRKLES